jgi:hypothetical protein
MNDPEIIIVPVLTIVPTAAIVIRMLLRHREKMATVRQTTDTSEHEARLARVEHAVEAIAVEVERVGEGQRFLTKVLTERLPSLTEATGVVHR